MNRWRRAIILICASACVLLAALPREARAQESASPSLNGQTCPTAGAPFVDPLRAPHWNGWGVDATQRRFQPSDMAGLAAEDAPRLKLKWAFGFPGVRRAFAQPTVFGGRLFVGSEGGAVYSLDAGSGCTYWRHDAGAGVRTAVVIGPRADGFSAYFGDLHANVTALDAVTGKVLWRTKVEDHPAAIITGAPTLVGTTLYVPVSSFEEVTGAPIGAARSAAASSRWRRRAESSCGRATPSPRSPSPAR
jgi:polyvinyl alcohol dehydrogenase (cytochrome)